MVGGRAVSVGELWGLWETGGGEGKVEGVSPGLNGRGLRPRHPCAEDSAKSGVGGEEKKRG